MASSYHRPAIEDTHLLLKAVDNVLNQIQRSRIAFDAVAFRGLSGSAIAPTVAMMLDKRLIYVRRRCEMHGEDSSHGAPVEMPRNNVARYIIIDDFISSGGTVKAIIEDIQRFSERPFSLFEDTTRPHCVGIFLWDDTKEGTREQRIFSFGRLVPIFMSNVT